MRLIDAEPIERALFRWADKSLAKNPYKNARICAFRRAFELILDAPTITPPPNDPLTLDQLREMDGEPVWIDDIVFRRDRSCGGLWAIVVLACDEIIFGDRNSMPLKDVVGFAYRRKPEEGRDEMLQMRKAVL